MLHQVVEQQYIHENKYLYSIVEGLRFAFEPFHSYIDMTAKAYSTHDNIFKNTAVGNMFAANLEMWQRLTKRYGKPHFGINSVIVNNEEIGVYEDVIVEKPFGNLLHFAKVNYDKKNEKKLLIVAPMSGHYPTLLRGTVKDILPHFDVYITEWINARDVPVLHGKFDLDDFIDYVIEFINEIGDNVHVLAICQPTVPVLAASALMAEDKKSAKIASIILTGGPVDARISPTDVDNFANTRQMNWFEENMITNVPANYPGFMRAVYPGFIQLAGFMGMNMQRHFGEHFKLYQHLIRGDDDEAEMKRKFYDEYLAVMDMPAEFYLQTIRTAFKDFSLPRGTMYSNGRHVNTKALKDPAMLILEGELDDISGIGQTKAALSICPNIPKDRKKYHLQAGVGHYGVFNGSKYRNSIVPIIDEFTTKFDLHNAKTKH